MSGAEKERPYTMSCRTPVVVVVFNRPELARAVFNVLKKARPASLFIVADGPREGHPKDVALCEETRAVFENISWPCTVQRNLAATNLGCGRRPSSGLDWAFGQVDRAVVLEDDCLPDLTFFRFCDEMLDRYADDERIMMVSGMNIAGIWKQEIQSYHFSYYGSTWGWATWRRAWQHYDYDMPLWWSGEVQNRIRDVLADDAQFRYRQSVFSGNHDRVWDYQWNFVRLLQSGLSIVPARNMISNAGFGGHATHTKDTNSPLARIPRQSMTFPLKHPSAIAVDRDYDAFWFKTNAPSSFQCRSVWRSCLQRLRDRWWK